MGSSRDLCQRDICSPREAAWEGVSEQLRGLAHIESCTFNFNLEALKLHSQILILNPEQQTPHHTPKDSSAKRCSPELEAPSGRMQGFERPNHQGETSCWICSAPWRRPAASASSRATTSAPTTASEVDRSSNGQSTITLGGSKSL